MKRILLSTAFATLAAFITFPLFAKPVPDNLGNGLDKLVPNNLIQQGKIISVSGSQTSVATTTTKSTRKSATRTNKLATATATTTTATQTFDAYKAMIAEQSAGYAAQAVTDATTGNYLVEIMPNGRVPVTTLQTTLQTAYPAMTVQAVDQN